jgi:hypothetical protein
MVVTSCHCFATFELIFTTANPLRAIEVGSIATMHASNFASPGVALASFRAAMLIGCVGTVLIFAENVVGITFQLPARRATIGTAFVFTDAACIQVSNMAVLVGAPERLGSNTL